MNTFLEIIKIVLPSLVVFAASYYTLDRYLKQETDNKKQEQQKLDRKVTLPLRLQAYERIILFLERIAPEHLLIRVQQPKMTVGQLQKTLLLSIRAEYEHNLSQQIYISEDAWELVKASKENLIRIINMAAASIKQDAIAFELSKKLMEVFASIESSPIQASINKIKTEAAELL
ncbi:MAG: hypothetical protein KAI79_08930 [Bacteroidales bacterium]|nr:hypothetical protein [Bacteroidales bacterium]